MNFFRILLFLSSFLIFTHSPNCFAQPKHTFPNLISLRTKQYPLEKYKKIIIRTPLRTGSTLVYNVVRTLFEDKENYNTNGFDSSVTLVSKQHIELCSP